MRQTLSAFKYLSIVPTLCAVMPVFGQQAKTAEPKFIDHSLLIAPEYPCTWPAAPFPKFKIVHEHKIGPRSAYNIDLLLIDGNTGTQLDVPPHSVARPDLNRPKSGPLGLATTDKIEAWQVGGEACVVDTRDLLDKAPPGVSPLVTAAHVERFEKAHRRVGFGDVVLFRSDYSDKYYQPMPAGSRFIADVVDKKAPGYPDPEPACMDFLGKRGVLALGTDSASMGPMPDMAEDTHFAGLKYGMIWTESATNLAALPPTGAFYCFLGPKYEGGPYGEGRAFSIVGGDLPAKLIDACKNKKVIDLSPVNSPKLPITSPGRSTGEHRQVYLKLDFLYSEYLDMWHHAHLLDSMAGTHLVPPSYSLPKPGETIEYSNEIMAWQKEYEAKYGPRGTSEMTTDKVPLEWTSGPLRMIDVRSLIGSTNKSNWPVSPEITIDLIKSDEARNGAIVAGQVVAFYTGHVDKYLQPAPDDKPLWANPLAGKAEGWPAPGPDAILYLKSKGVRCVATDAPDLGGTEPKRALMTYWALGTARMAGVEFLQNFAKLPLGKNIYFLFAALKIKDCHGGPGRAIAAVLD